VLVLCDVRVCVCVNVCVCVSVCTCVSGCQHVPAAVDAVTSPSDDVTCDANKLNDDVILHVFTYLSLRDRARCERGESYLPTTNTTTTNTSYHTTYTVSQ